MGQTTTRIVSICGVSYSYAGLSTEKCASLCADPLCNHLDGSGCKYLELSMLMTSPDSDELLYAEKRDSSYGTLFISRIDVQKDVIEKIYPEKKDLSGSPVHSRWQLCLLQRYRSQKNICHRYEF